MWRHTMGWAAVWATVALTHALITAEVRSNVRHPVLVDPPVMVTADAVLQDDAEHPLNATLIHNGVKVDLVLPAGVLTVAIAREVCGGPFVAAFLGNTAACVTEASLQISRRRSPQMLYRRWVNKKYLMAFPLQERMSTAAGVNLTCSDPYGVHPKLNRSECEDIAWKEIRSMRYGGKWKTKTPADAVADTLPYWDAVKRLETELERRGYMVYDGHIAHCPQKVKMFMDVMRDSPKITNICEIGFNAGHSALAWLSILPHTTVLSFDLGTHPYLKPAANIINEMYPGRLSVVMGDSAVTVPQFIASNPDYRCNVLFVDGSHDYEPVLKDLRHFSQMANQTFGHILLVDDFGCVEPYCRNVRTAFYRMVHELSIQERRVITTEEYTHLVGGGETAVVNGMAAGLYLSDMQAVNKPFPEWVPFAETW